MRSDGKFLKSYFSQISALLMCDRKTKHMLLRELRGNVTDWLAENEGAKPEDILSVFGTPEQIAESTLQGIPPAALKKKISLTRAVMIALLLALLIWAAFAVAGLIDVHTEAHGYFEEGLLRLRFPGGLPL